MKNFGQCLTARTFLTSLKFSVNWTLRRLRWRFPMRDRFHSHPTLQKLSPWPRPGNGNVTPPLNALRTQKSSKNHLCPLASTTLSTTIFPIRWKTKSVSTALSWFGKNCILRKKVLDYDCSKVLKKIIRLFRIRILEMTWIFEKINRCPYRPCQIMERQLSKDFFSQSLKIGHPWIQNFRGGARRIRLRYLLCAKEYGHQPRRVALWSSQWRRL